MFIDIKHGKDGKDRKNINLTVITKPQDLLSIIDCSVVSYLDLNGVKVGMFMKESSFTA